MRTLSELPLVLSTSRLTLRPFVAEDVDALWPIVSVPSFPRFMTWSAHQDRTQTQAFIAAQHAAVAAGTDIAWAVTLAGRLAGVIGLHGITHMQRVLRVDRAELGYWTAPAEQNRGVATEAGRAVLEFGFRELGLHKINVLAIKDNLASVRVIEKLGFRRVGEQRAHVFREERWWDQLSFEMLADDWPRQTNFEKAPARV